MTICALVTSFAPRGLEPERVIRAPQGAGPGLQLAAVGDVDADGRSDYIVAVWADSRRVHRRGSVQLVSGASGRVLFERAGESFDECLGWCIGGPGDVDADGTPDLLIGGFAEGQRARFDVLTASGNRIRSFEMPRVPDARSRLAAVGAGDRNRDGHADIVLCYGDGKVHVRSGKDGRVLVTLHPSIRDEPLTPPVGPAGDVDGDGQVDFFAWSEGGMLIACSGADGVELGRWAGASRSGCFLDDVDGDGWREVALRQPYEQRDGTRSATDDLYVLSGRTGAELFRCEDDRQEFFTELGASMTRLGDVDGDGFADIAAGAPEHDDDDEMMDFGRVVIFSGRDGRVLGAALGSAENTCLGEQVVDLGDLDGDGISEVAAPGWERDSASSRRSNAWFVFSGAELVGRPR